jgi:hypothetical protein
MIQHGGRVISGSAIDAASGIQLPCEFQMGEDVWLWFMVPENFSYTWAAGRICGIKFLPGMNNKTIYDVACEMGGLDLEDDMYFVIENVTEMLTKPNATTVPISGSANITAYMEQCEEDTERLSLQELDRPVAIVRSLRLVKNEPA